MLSKQQICHSKCYVGCSGCLATTPQVICSSNVFHQVAAQARLHRGTVTVCYVITLNFPNILNKINRTILPVKIIAYTKLCRTDLLCLTSSMTKFYLELYILQ